MRYLFNAWDSVRDKVKENNLFIFLDFDGTLAPIASRPDKVILSEAVKKILEKMSKNPKIKLVFISGRKIDDIKNRIGIKNAVYSGCHGLQLEGKGIKFKPHIASGYRRIINQIKNDLGENISHIKGAFIEDKGLILSLHYRLVERKEIPLLKKIFYDATTSYLAENKIKIKQGKMVFEVFPPVDWDKGKIVLQLLEKSKNVFPIYIGDDVSDEDAFKVLKRKGLTIFIGKPNKSIADYYLKNTQDVRKFLHLIMK